MLNFLPFLIIIPFGLSIFAQRKIIFTFIKYNISSKKQIKGSRLATEILTLESIHNIRIEKAKNKLIPKKKPKNIEKEHAIILNIFTNHYEHNIKAIRLSEFVYSNSTIASVAVAAYITAKAIFHKKKHKKFMQFIKFEPFINFISYMGISFFILGMIFFTIGLINFVIPTIGVFLYYVSIAFYLYFFKIETDKKAYELIEKGNYLTPEECELAKEVLKAYKLTYIASFAIVLAKLIENFKAYKKKYE